ncbi:MAG TPA: patatin-like phospholipase family protein [Nitrososphaeraceae archaeon]|jgi:NTE family protein|nr:patatin-like phospholipase family protein [Nitrososphaeraceae archaeon]
MYQHKHNHNKDVENVLILQGGGSLGAFASGVFKAFARKNIKFDIICGTSIGAINGAIVVGSKNDNPEKDLEDFWIELAESSINVIPDMYSLDYDEQTYKTNIKRSSSASLNAALFGVPKFFVPRWFNWNSFQYKNSHDSNILPSQWTYIYDNTPLEKTLEKYIDLTKLSPNIKKENIDNNTNNKNVYNNSNPRLIITAVNVLSGQPIIFDSYTMPIQMKHLLATIGYPQYGFPWVDIDNGIYAWDGSLLSNTPVREVMVASPSNDKNIFIVENYPKKINKLPSNMTEVQSRAKDIMFTDKDESLRKISKLITRHINLIETLYDIFKENDISNIDKATLEYIEKEHRLLVEKFGAKILKIYRISRENSETPHSTQNAEFSLTTIKNLIVQGENKALECLNKIN